MTNQRRIKMFKNITPYIVGILLSAKYSKQSSLSESTEELNDITTEKATTEKLNNETANEKYTNKLVNLNKTIYSLNNTQDLDVTLAKLEEEKSKLYSEIIKSIDDSVLLLENTNDTEAKLGINFMKDLKYQLENINGTDSTLPKKDDRDINRRSLVEKKITLTYDEIASIFKTKNKSSIFSSTDVVAQDLEMKKKIDDWILQRYLEKQKISDYKNKMSKYLAKLENCPRFGQDKKTIKVNGKSRKRYRPCCRKCCKRSYLGCL